MASLDKVGRVMGVEAGTGAGEAGAGIPHPCAGELWHVQLVYIYLERRNDGLWRR